MKEFSMMPPFYIIALWAAAIVCLDIYLAKKLRYLLQMLQQNSYRNKRWLTWCWEHVNKVFYLIRDLMPVFAIQICRFVDDYGLTIAICWVLFIEAFNAFTYQRGKDNKSKIELVMTPRAKRVYGLALALAIIASLLIFASLFFGDLIIPSFAAIMGCCFFCFFFLLLANIILMPLESKINKGYLDEAYRLLHSVQGLQVVGVTGSYGKTSCKMILGEILKEKYNTLVTPESYNTPMGITRTVREQLRPTCEVFVAEMGAKQVGDIKELCDLTNPTLGIITAIGEQHLETFKTVNNVISTKFELGRALPADGVLLLNFDDTNIKDNVGGLACKVVSYGIRGKWDYYADEINYTHQGSVFKIHGPDGEEQEFCTALLGRHNVVNIVAAVAAAHQMGVSFAAAAKAVRGVAQIPHRLQHLEGPGGYHILDDAFNSNPMGARAALEVLSKFKDGKRILVTPGMVELGPQQKQLNREFAIAAAKCCDHIILVGRGITEPLQEGLRQVGYPKKRYFIALTLKEAREELNRILEPGDTVLFENDLPDTYNE